ncbi:hypothetical protein DBR32_08965 [Taibaiella sp. KBW10]|nr:hypothetical protein DBR32_08965 [Taibaiella sp. KBW10]
MIYDRIDKGKLMIYEADKKRITIRDAKQQTESVFLLSDIRHVFHIMTTPMAEKRRYYFPWDSYNYSEIYLNNGERYTITSLMVHRLELPVGSRYQVVTAFYPYPEI